MAVATSLVRRAFSRRRETRADFVSIIVPVYNERESIRPMLDEVRNALAGWPHGGNCCS